MTLVSKLFAILILFLIFSLLPEKTYANGDFTTEYDVTYTVKEDGVTNARVDAVITNKTSQFFASSYTLQVGFDDIHNVKASDSEGEIHPTVTKNDAGHAIALTFNRKSVGLNSKLPFTVSFETKDIAKKQGKIWEINIPGVSDPSDFSDFTVTVHPPKSLSSPVYTKPQKQSQELVFSKEDLGKSGISIAFGENQIYGYKLSYHLKNTNIFPIQTEIALPPTTNYQEVIIDSLSPKPSAVAIDRDGNWIATYALSPSQKIDVIASGKVRLLLRPKKESLSDELRREYTKPRRYWESDNEKINDLATKLRTPENIYRYVVSTLKYDFSRVNTGQERLGAVNALENKSTAVCLEFTDLFIALARAAGIPSRELNGYAHTENSKQRPLSLVTDILHAWPEYYDEKKQTWIMVDPTWGNTTGGIDYFNVFDFDHIVFVRKGTDSIYPVPAGGYKLEEDREKKDIRMAFAYDFVKKDGELRITPEVASIYPAGFPIRGKVVVENIGNTLSRPELLAFASSRLRSEPATITISPLPPFGKEEKEFGFGSTSLLTNEAFEFTITRRDATTYHTFTVSPFVMTKLRLLGGAFFVVSGLIILIITITAWRIRVLRRRK